MAEEDYLEVDRQIPGQNYCCVSFVSPEKTLKDKNIYFLSEYLRDLVKTKTNDETAEFREKNDLLELLKTGDLSYEKIKESYDGFLYRESSKLENVFYEKNDFKTTVRGVKIRGTYDTQREAEMRAKLLRKRDPNFHIYVGQVGYWLPWDPDPDDVGNQEYQESHLNTLVKKYEENKESRDDMYEQLKRENMETAKKKNAEKKKKLELKEEDNDVESAEKLGGLRELLNVKDGQYDELMDSSSVKESDPWMQRKEEEKRKEEMEKKEENVVLIE